MKKIISVLLSLIMVLTLIVPLTASAVESDGTPIVYVRGFGMCSLVKDKGDDTEKQLYFPEAKTILEAVKDFSPFYLKFKVTNNYDDLADGIIKLGNTLFEDLKCDDEGNSIKKVDIDPANEVTAEQEYGKLNYFNYDWRIDVTETAEDLNDYINAILEATGKEKICLVCESMGGCVGAAYLVKYGYSKCSSIIMSSVATLGVEMLDDILKGELKVRPDKFYDYLIAVRGIAGNDALNALIYAFDQLGGFDAVLTDIGNAIDKCLPKVYAEFAYPVISRMPGVWSFVVEENFEKAKEMAGVEKGSVLEQKLNNYHQNVAPYIKSLLKNAMNDGVKLAILSGYNLTNTPLTVRDDYQSDYLIATKETSFGAITADHGTTLGENYKQAVDDGHNHISPDNLIDASTCWFPENTWLVKDMTHMRMDIDFFCWVAYTDGEVNITANENYPQFVYYKDGKYLPNNFENGDTESKGLKIVKKIIEIFAKCVAIIKNLLF